MYISLSYIPQIWAMIQLALCYLFTHKVHADHMCADIQKYVPTTWWGTTTTTNLLQADSRWINIYNLHMLLCMLPHPNIIECIPFRIHFHGYQIKLCYIWSPLTSSLNKTALWQYRYVCTYLSMTQWTALSYASIELPLFSAFLAQMGQTLLM